MLGKRTTDGGTIAGLPFSLIGEGVTITGNIDATVDLHIAGRVVGDVACQTLTQEATGAVVGNIAAKVARIGGTVEGSVTADEIVLEASAKVTGDCNYAVLTVATGASIEGRFHQQGPAAPELKVVAANG